MTTEQTISAGTQTVSALQEKKDLRSGFNKAFGIAVLIVIIMQFIGTVITVAMIIPLVFEALQESGATTPEEIALVQQKVMAVASSQLKYVFVPTIIGILGAYLVMVPVGCKMLKFRFKDFLSTKGFSGKLLGFGIIMGLGAQMMFSCIANVTAGLLEQVGIRAVTINTTFDGDPVGIISMIVASCICAPFFEEILFRGILLKTLSKKNVWFGITVSSIAFGLYHFNIQQFIAATAMGFVMAIVASKANSLVPSIIIHFVLNAHAMIQQMIYYYTGEECINIITTIELIVFVLASIAVIIFKRKIFAPEKQDTVSESGEQVKSLPVLLSSWTAWIFVVIMIVTIMLTLKVM